MQTFKKNSWILITIILPFFFFFTPKIKEFKGSEISCFKNIKYNNQVLYIHNCDVHSITSSSQNFTNYLFEWKENPWIGRPLHILVGVVGAPIMAPIAIIINKFFISKLNFEFNKSKFMEKTPIYLSFYLFNFFLLFISAKAIFYLLGSDDTEKTLIAVILALSDMVNGWFWTGHSIFIGHIIPIISLISFFIGYLSNSIEEKRFYFFSILLGLGCILYQFSIVWLGTFFLGYLLSLIKKEKKQFRKIFIFIIIYITPLLLWYLFNKIFDKFLFYEASKYSQFIWIFKSIELNEFTIVFSNQFKEFWNNFSRSLGFYWILPCLIIIYHFIKFKKSIDVFKHPFFYAFISAILLQILFNFAQGEYQTRFINPLITILNLFSIWFVQRYSRRNFNFIAILIISSQIFFSLKFPPLSVT